MTLINFNDAYSPELVMKNFLILFIYSLLIISCVSTNIEYYSTSNVNSNKLFMQLDQSTSTVTTGGIGYTVYGLSYLSTSSETVKLGTIKNTEMIKKVLTNKGYQIVNSADEADIIMIGESTSNSDYSKVILGFYNKNTTELMFSCEGKYGLEWGVEDDLKKAIKKALESVPTC